jgi:gamma-glutamylputrescine oxidase
MADGGRNYYRATANAAPALASLEGVREASVCIVGGGFAGLGTALGLAERGRRDVVLLESRQVAHGASGRNGGFVFAGYSRGEASLLRDLGPERAASLYRGTRDAVELIRGRIDRYRIACDRTEAGVLWANWFRDPDVLRSRQQLLAERFDTHWQWIGHEELRERLVTERYSAALFESSAFHFHPLNYALGIAEAARRQGVAMYEGSPAIGLHRDGAGWRVRTPSGEVRAAQVVLCCGGYLAGLRSGVDAAVLPIATYVMVSEPLGARLREAIRTDAAVYDTRFAFDYYRALPDTRLLWGGRISVRDRSAADVQRLLQDDLRRVYPQLAGIGIAHAWSGLMSYARHEMPQIGQIEPGLWLAQAFGGHGVGPTTHAGEVLASAIAEGDPRWKDFSAYPLASTFKPAGYAAAQLNYWWLQFRDAWKAWREESTR